MIAGEGRSTWCITLTLSSQTTLFSLLRASPCGSSPRLHYGARVCVCLRWKLKSRRWKNQIKDNSDAVSRYNIIIPCCGTEPHDGASPATGLNFYPLTLHCALREGRIKADGKVHKYFMRRAPRAYPSMPPASVCTPASRIITSLSPASPWWCCTAPRNGNRDWFVYTAEVD